jgi:hypothetical protein
MRIHTTHPLAHTTTLCRAALERAQAAGRVAPGVYFDKITAHGSRTHTSAAEVHLVSDTKEPGSKRRRPNSGTVGADGRGDVWAATWAEWGWFMAEVFAADPGARMSYDRDAAAFHARTRDQFRI